eukprot:UN23630
MGWKRRSSGILPTFRWFFFLRKRRRWAFYHASGLGSPNPALNGFPMKQRAYQSSVTESEHSSWQRSGVYDACVRDVLNITFSLEHVPSS